MHSLTLKRYRHVRLEDFQMCIESSKERLPLDFFVTFFGRNYIFHRSKSNLNFPTVLVSIQISPKKDSNSVRIFNSQFSRNYCLEINLYRRDF